MDRRALQIYRWQVTSGVAQDAVSIALHPNVVVSFRASVAIYALALMVALVRPRWGRGVVAAGIVAHAVMTVLRGIAIAYFPLTNKMESFSAAALALAIVGFLCWRPHRLYVGVFLALLLMLMGAAWRFGLDLRYPVAPLITIWYPLHVPLSFFAYATWSVAAIAALTWFVDGGRQWLRDINQLTLWGFGLWSLSMICGGVWGVVAWGAYFLWDPKIIWSVILWFHYATLLHVGLTPSLRRYTWVVPVYALVGFVWIFIAYVGTSFLFGASSHAF